ncbi:MAG TPA: Ig-like domain-containing protein [Candidatus Limnocylindrales bacterium]
MAPSPQRLARHRRIDRRRGMPLPFGAVLAAAVLVLGIGVLWIANGVVGPVVAGVANGIGGLVNTVGEAVGSAPPTAAPVTSDAPSIVASDQPFTNDDTVDVSVNVPSGVVGLPGYTVRLWVAVGDSDPVVAAEQPVGETAVQVLPNIALVKGANAFQASVVGPGGESERSPVVTWTLDTSKPKLTIISPKDGATTSKDNVTIKGKTQANSSVRVRNDDNGATTTVDADRDGLFQARIAIAAGINSIIVTTTDPAGNPNEATLSIRKGSGKPSARLTANTYQFRAGKLPKPITLTVTVTDPDGSPVQGATALFTVSVPGLEAIVSSEIKTNANGVARFATTIPKGAMAGAGLATVLISTDEFGNLTDRQVLTVRH